MRENTLDLSDLLDVNGDLKISLDDTVGYPLADGDQFNFKKIITVEKVGDKQFYTVLIGYKNPWQEWLAFKDAPTSFYDVTQQNNGLNQKSSNYSTNGDYQIRYFVTADVSQNGVVTTYRGGTEEINVYDYDEDDTGQATYTCIKGTYKEDGTSLEQNVIDKEFTKVIIEFDPLVDPTFSESVDFTEVANDWPRFAHGNKCSISQQVNVRMNGGVPGTGSFGSISPAVNVAGSWANNQAGEVNGVLDSMQGINYVYFNNETADYSSTTDSIQTTDNIAALYGCYSLDKYEYYEINGEMFSSNGDDDGLAYTVAFHVDELGVESTLSLMATTGGLVLDINPGYVDGDETTNVFQFKPSNFEVVNWALVYNFGKSDCKQLGVYYTTQNVIGWGSLNQTTQTFKFNVKRSSNEIEVNGDWDLPAGSFSNSFTYDLNDNEETKKFNGARNIGFSFMSQNNGGFKNVDIVVPTADYYGIVRIEPNLNPADNGKQELSTDIEGKSGNLLKQVEGNQLVSDLQYDGDVFYLSALINTSKVKSGQDYDISGQIGLKNLGDRNLLSCFAWVDSSDRTKLYVMFNTSIDLTNVTVNGFSLQASTIDSYSEIDSVNNFIVFLLDSPIDEGSGELLEYDNTNTVESLDNSLSLLPGSIEVYDI